MIVHGVSLRNNHWYLETDCKDVTSVVSCSDDSAACTDRLNQYFMHYSFLVAYLVRLILDMLILNIVSRPPSQLPAIALTWTTVADKATQGSRGGVGSRRGLWAPCALSEAACCGRGDSMGS